MAKRKPRNERNDKNEYDEVDEMIYENRKNINKNFKIKLKPKGEGQKQLYQKILDNRIVFVRGSAGTGKSLIALLSALFMLKNPNLYNIHKILITKPIVESSSNSLGYLKGTLQEKTYPYFLSLIDNFEKILGKETSNYLRQNGLVDEVVLNFVRGCTFGDYDLTGKPLGVVAVLDEAQNTTVKEMKTFISRMGEDSRLIIIGDSQQVDIKIPRVEKNGLDDSFERFVGIDGIAFHEFTNDEIIREPMLIEIMKRYDTV